MLLHHRRDRTDHRDRLGRIGLGDVDRLEAAGERRVLLEILPIFGIGGRGDRAQPPARQRGLEQVGGVAGAGRAARADQRVRFVDEQDDRRGAALDLVDHRAQALLELALHARARLHQADVEAAQRHALQHRRHVAVDDALGEALDHRGLADARLADQDRVVLAAAQQDVDQPGGSRRRGRRSCRSRPIGPWRSDRPKIWPAPRPHPRTAIGLPAAAGAGRAEAEPPPLSRLRHLARLLGRGVELVAQLLDLDLANSPDSANSAFRSVGVLSIPYSRWPVRTRPAPNCSEA